VQKNKLLLGICGSISAYKAPFILREFVKLGYEVRCVMTESAKQFVTPTVLSNLSHFDTVVDMFDPRFHNDGSWHIHLAHWADCMVIAPCSATTLAKLSLGSADNALQLLALSLKNNTPLIIAPAMDSDMWEHPTTKRNINTVKSDGAIVIPPDSGELASGLNGIGRLPEPQTIVSFVHNRLTNSSEPIIAQSIHSKVETAHYEFVDHIDNTVETEAEPIYINTLATAVEKDEWQATLELELLKQTANSVTASIKDFSKEVIVITAGPTQEPIDDVRYITNHSSGKMGYALAEVARNFGAKVILISGPVQLPAPDGVELIQVTTSQQMFDAVQQYATSYTIGIMAAAVADFTPEYPVVGKIKKDQSTNQTTLQLKKTNDILHYLGHSKQSGQFLAGFALESEALTVNALKKLSTKRADMIIGNYANKPNSGFNGDMNTLHLFYSNGVMEQLEPMSKHECAVEILTRIALYKTYLSSKTV
jgi:phosphopantothenoylcysteine decarboxylase/phosphopantothenate--cysteine ligase